MGEKTKCLLWGMVLERAVRNSCGDFSWADLQMSDLWTQQIVTIGPHCARSGEGYWDNFHCSFANLVPGLPVGRRDVNPFGGET